MTEKEAKTKWCPFARTIFARRAGDNSITVRAPQVAFNIYTMDEADDRAIPGGATCIGSACMAFRQHGWRDKEDGQIKSMAYDRADPQFWEPMFHCGLAGRP